MRHSKRVTQRDGKGEVPLEAVAGVEGMSYLAFPVVVVSDEPRASGFLVRDAPPQLACLVNLQKFGRFSSKRVRHCQKRCIRSVCRSW